jgi:hypothetical protein
MTSHAEQATIDLVRHLRTENSELRRSNAELRFLLNALADGFEAINDWSGGRLRELVEQGAKDMARLVDLLVDENEEDTC